jgi:hypothetical protein
MLEPGEYERFSLKNWGCSDGPPKQNGNFSKMAITISIKCQEFLKAFALHKAVEVISIGE